MLHKGVLFYWHLLQTCVYSISLVNIKNTISVAPPKCGPKTDVLFLIHSRWDFQVRRETIRNTWANSVPHSRTVFVVATPSGQGDHHDREQLRLENDQHEDLLILNSLDTYKNLTYKHLSAYAWVAANCPSAKYIVKADDDVFVDTHHLPDFLEFHLGTLDRRAKFLLCYVHKDRRPVRQLDDPTDAKWFVTADEYKRDVFPYYCSGSAYVTNIPTIKSLLTAQEHLEYLFIDDVFVTGLAAEKDCDIDFYDWSQSFLVEHAADEELILSAKVGFYSPHLLVAFNMRPRDIELLQAKADSCLRQRDKCYDLVYQQSGANLNGPKLLKRQGCTETNTGTRSKEEL